jgi:hypothetical protein
MEKTHKYTTNIPAAREALNKIAHELEIKGEVPLANEIREIVENKMVRRQGPRRAPISRKQVTPQIRDKVIHDLKNTDLPQEDIARKYNIDGGRVSEIWGKIRN